MPTSTRTTMAVCTLAAAWAVGTAAWAQQPGASQAAALEPPVGEYSSAQAQARRPLEQILRRVRSNCEGYDKRKRDEEEYYRRNPRPRSQVDNPGLFKPSPREVAEQREKLERSERDSACSPTEDEKRRLNEARCGWRECTEPLPAVQNAFVGRVVPGLTSAVEISAQRVESSLRQMGDPVACSADTRAALASVATGLARWNEFAQTVQASVPSGLMTCSALCASLARSATAICAADAVVAPADRAAAWKRAADDVTANSFGSYGTEGCACQKARPSLDRVLESRARHSTTITTGIAREQAERDTRGRAESDARATREAVVGAAQAAAKPEAAAAAYRRGYEIYMRSDFNGALPDLKEAVRLDPESVTYNRFLGEALRRGGDGVAALPYLERALAKAPKDAWLHMSLAQALALAGRKDSAIRAAEQAAALWPDNEFIRRDRDQLIRSQR